MRIISQDGNFDLPYDKCFIWINNGEIMVQTISEPDSDYMFANYSTLEKAEKAMQILHEAYIVHENFKKMDAEAQLKVLGCIEKETKLMYGGIFQFPREEEL